MSSVAAARLHPFSRVALLVVVLGALFATALVATTSAQPAHAARYWGPVPAAAKTYPTLQYGSRGSAVVYLQKRLFVRATGFYGTLTRAAVIRWERRAGLAPDGRITKGNWRALGVPYVRTARASSAVPAGSKQARIAAVARQHLGGPYVRGGNGPRVFDCSGFVRYVVKKATGRTLPRIATDQMRATRRISKAQARPGDLVFVRAGSRTSHAAVVAGGGYWYEAANPRKPVGKYRAWTSNVIYTRVS